MSIAAGLTARPNPTALPTIADVDRLLAQSNAVRAKLARERADILSKDTGHPDLEKIEAALAGEDRVLSRLQVSKGAAVDRQAVQASTVATHRQIQHWHAVGAAHAAALTAARKLDTALAEAASAVTAFRQTAGNLGVLVGHSELHGILAGLGNALPQINTLNLAPRLLDLDRTLWLAGKR
jgi:hypothetical protein